MEKVSIHAPLARSNFDRVAAKCPHCGFNTCSSCEEQPVKDTNAKHFFLVSIHAPLARSNKITKQNHIRFSVSIHAPLARSNAQEIAQRFDALVSIHAPLARSNYPVRLYFVPV